MVSGQYERRDADGIRFKDFSSQTRRHDPQRLDRLTCRHGQQLPVYKASGYERYPLVNLQKTSKNYGKSQFLMGELTINGNFQ